MKAYLFIETGEVRRPNGGEYYIRSGGIMGCPVEGYPYSRTIVTRHEIEIPDDHSEFHCWSGNLSETNVTHIPLSHPKKKVKKWRWAMATKKGKDVGITNHMTEEELHRYYPNQMWYQKLDSTMIEVEGCE